MLGYKTIEDIEEFTLAECEAFLKRNDISEEDRQRAEKRRDFLIAPPKPSVHHDTPNIPVENIMDRFSEYKFVPSSLAPMQRKDPARHLRISAWFGLIAYIVPGIICFVFSSQAKKKGNVLTDIADYISTSKTGVKKGYGIFIGNYAIFAKNNKMGMVNGINQIIIPAEYDKLSWSEHKDVLRAELDGRSFLIDIHGNVLN